MYFFVYSRGLRPCLLAATPNCGVRIYFCIIPGVLPLAQLYARAILYRPSLGLKKSAR